MNNTADYQLSNSKSQTQMEASKSMEVPELPQVRQSRLGSVHDPYAMVQVGLFESEKMSENGPPPELELSVVDQANESKDLH
jgi:hypothetical protein